MSAFELPCNFRISSDLSKHFLILTIQSLSCRRHLFLKRLTRLKIMSSGRSFSTCDFEDEYIFHAEIKQVSRLKGKPQLFVIKSCCLQGQF